MLLFALASPLLLGCPRGQTPGGAAGEATQGGLPGSTAGQEGQGRPTAGAGLQLLRQGDLDGAEPILAAALKAAPGDARLLEALGFIYARTDRWQRAEEMYRAALAATPPGAGARLGLATVLTDTGRYGEALLVLRELLREHPENGAARLKEALLLQRTGRAAEAAERARAIATAHPEAHEAHYILGLALEDQADLTGALAAFERTAALQPEHVGALSHAATVASRLGLRDKAEQARRAHGEALLKRRVEERVRGHRLKGVEAFNREDFERALAEFEAVAREDPRDPQAHLYIGSALLALGRRPEARAAINRSLALDPRSERALMELGRLEALDERLDEAIVALDRAVALNPEFAEPHYFLAGIYQARGDPVRARQAAARYEELRRRSAGGAMEVVDPVLRTGP